MNSTKPDAAEPSPAWTVESYRGVYWDGNTWTVTIPVAGITFLIGRYPSKYLAAYAYNVAAQILNGEHALLNSILDEHLPPRLIRHRVREQV